MLMINVDRETALAYRVTALGLADRGSQRPADLAVLDLGLQEYTPDSVQVALAARTDGDLDDDRLTSVWAARGAPHRHRRSDLADLVRQLWPVSDADATARITSAQIPDGMKLGIRAFTVTAEALREVVTAPMPRGEASTEVSRRVPPELTYECRACGSRHIAGNVWQHAGLAGGIEVLSRGKGARLGPLPDPPPPVSENSGVDRLIETYLRFLGPAGPAEVATYLGSKAAAIREVWPTGLTEVRVDGRKAWLPSEQTEALESATRPSGVRWLPPMDPLLQARDRDLLLPDRAAQKEMWRPLGNPGALLLDGEIAAVWRARMSGRKRVNLSVTGFAPLTPAQRKRIDAEAPQVARARGVPEATVTYEE